MGPPTERVPDNVYGFESYVDPSWETGRFERRFVMRGDKFVPIDARLDDIEHSIMRLRNAAYLAVVIASANMVIEIGPQAFSVISTIAKLMGKL